MGYIFIEKGTKDTLIHADSIVYITKYRDNYIMQAQSELKKTESGGDFRHNRCEFELFSDFESFIKDFSPRNIYYSIYEDPVYE